MRLNLLPHREARRRRQRQVFLRMLAASAGLGLLAAALGYAGLQQRTAAQQQRNDLLVAEAARLEGPLQTVARLRREIAALQVRQQSLQALQFERERPVRLFEALARHTGAGVQLTTLRQHGDAVTLGGVALGSAEVAALVSDLAAAAPVLQQPTLVELKAAAPTASAAEARRRSDFTLELRLQPASGTVAEAGVPASAPARAASAVGRAAEVLPRHSAGSAS